MRQKLNVRDMTVCALLDVYKRQVLILPTGKRACRVLF